MTAKYKKILHNFDLLKVSWRVAGVQLPEEVIHHRQTEARDFPRHRSRRPRKSWENKLLSGV